MIEKKQEELFFPYYVNQGRLLDIYAILNGGYSEYEEITTEINNAKKNNGSAEVNANVGFKIFNFGGVFRGGSEHTEEIIGGNKEKKVHTVTSILSIVKKKLAEKGYLYEVKNSGVGAFVCIPVVLSVNSINYLLEELEELMNLQGNINKIGSQNKTNNMSIDKNDIKNIKNVTKDLFAGKEIIYQNDEYAIFGNINEINLYQATMADIIGVELKCLAQIKKIYPNGTDLMKNTMFSKIKDRSAKKSFFDSILKITQQDAYSFDVVTIPSIDDKPVYQIEIIALYQ